jgi:predicted amidohydrolase YtcJ
VPGFVDAHIHVRASAAIRNSVDCSTVGTLAELMTRISTVAQASVRESWISFAGLSTSELRPRPPTRAELDAAACANPVRIRDRSLHGWLLNTRAAHAIGLADAPLENGLVVDEVGAVRRAFGRLSSASATDQAVREWSLELLRHGVVAIADATASNTESDVAQLVEWHETGVLAQDVRAFVGAAGPVSDRQLRGFVIGRKLVLEASHVNPERLRRELLGSWAFHPVVAVHCAEAATLGALIDAAEAIPPHRRRALRIEHASECPPEWIARVRALDATVVTHPAFVSAHGDRYRRTVPAPLHDWLYRIRSWISAGVAVAAASDAPAGPVPPLDAWRAAIGRRTASGATLGAAEAIDRITAMELITSRAAAASGFRSLGVLRPGLPGHGVLLSADPVETEPLGRVEVDGVVTGGRLLWCR